MDEESAQLAEMLTKLAIERVAMFGGLLVEKRRPKKLEEQEKDRLRTEAKELSDGHMSGASSESREPDRVGS